MPYKSKSGVDVPDCCVEWFPNGQIQPGKWVHGNIKLCCACCPFCAIDCSCCDYEISCCGIDCNIIAKCCEPCKNPCKPCCDGLLNCEAQCNAQLGAMCEAGNARIDYNF